MWNTDGTLTSLTNPGIRDKRDVVLDIILQIGITRLHQRDVSTLTSHIQIGIRDKRDHGTGGGPIGSLTDRD